MTKILTEVQIKRKDFERIKSTVAFREFVKQQLDIQKDRCYYCTTLLYTIEKIPIYKIQPEYVKQFNLPPYWIMRNDMYHVDHKVPLSRGGSNDFGNLVLSCEGCNLRKGTKILSD